MVKRAHPLAYAVEGVATCARSAQGSRGGRRRSRGGRQHACGGRRRSRGGRQHARGGRQRSRGGRQRARRPRAPAPDSLSMKEGRVSRDGLALPGGSGCAGVSWGSSGAHLSIASSRRRARASTRLDGNVASVAQLGEGRLCGQREGGAFRSEGLVAGEHVPDRLGEGAGELDLGDLGAALTADALLGLLVALAIERVL